MIRPLSCAILFVIACAAAPDTTTPATGLAFGPLPDSVIGLRGWVRVQRPNRPLDCGGVDAIGCYWYDTRELSVVRELTPYAANHTLEHEKVHMILGDAHLLHVGTTAQQDSVADAIATVRMLERLQRRCP